jgi:endonuclease YncB( thermonuclease family)
MAISRQVLLSVGVLVATGVVLAIPMFRPPTQSVVGVADVVDGDSLRINGIEVRLQGVDAPELNQMCGERQRQIACGRESRTALRRLIGTKLVSCDGRARDQYGRLLATCRSGGVDLNAAQVREGHAVAYGAYQGEEREAEAGFKGLWAAPFMRPSEWRRLHPSDQRR